MNKYVIAKYIRLSVDDGITESLSIPNQGKILDKFIDDLDIPNVEVIEKIDNGFTGTNMERPAVQELLELVRSGGVNMICVKDFSRFSRNAMDSGYFIEQVFPLFGVRFVSVSDNFDSDDYKGDTGGIDVAFKFLTHEYYSQDLSKKIKSALHVKQLRGEPISGSVPYGYKMSGDKKWEPNPETAEIVRLIFKLALDGCTTPQIRGTLFHREVPTPKEYAKLSRGRETLPTHRWSTDAIAQILANEKYLGTYISGKYERLAVGSGRTVETDPSKWIIIPDNHPPLISKEEFDRAQTDVALKGKTHIIADKVAKRRVKKDGSAMGLFPLYGYIFDEQHKPVINLKAAEAIRLIFQLALDGSGVPQICEALMQADFPTPGEQKALDRGENVTLSKAWTRGAVNNILRELQYTGVAVSNRNVIAAKVAEGEQKPMMPRQRPQSEWVITPNARPAIITEEIFNAVQEILAEKPKREKNKRNFLLKYKARCGCCGHSLSYDDGVGYPLFRCSHTIGDPTADCHKMKFLASGVDEVVLTAIRKQAEVILNTSKLNQLSAKGGGEQELSDYENRIAECNERRQKHYESFILREIDRSEYLKLKAECSDEIDRLNMQAAALRAELQSHRVDAQIVSLANQAVAETMPHKELVDALIEKVCVFPDRRIEIVWKIADFINNNTGVLENV
ncbi:hypothetical protein FACS1894202_10500 [Clostridia bacterium]|nr:hypothetical protein FACS1894202_10500 [Clostridia bacterium]